MGERNDALVSSLQQLLITNFGYDLGQTGPLKNGVDGDFRIGGFTDLAVKDFQVQYLSEQNITPKPELQR